MTKQVWVVQARPVFPNDADPSNDEGVCFAFTNRADAHKVYGQGEKTVVTYNWSITPIPLDDVSYALYHVDLLRKEEDAGEGYDYE